VSNTIEYATTSSVRAVASGWSHHRHPAPPTSTRRRPPATAMRTNRTPVRVVPVSGLLAGHEARFALRSLVNASRGTPRSETLCSRRRPGHPEDPADSEAARGSGSAPIARRDRRRRGRDAPAQRRCAARRAFRGTAHSHRSVAGGFPRRSPGLSRWLSLPPPRSNDGGRMPAGRDGCHAAGYAGPAPANTGQCQPPSPSCPVRCDDAALLAAGAPLQAPAVRLVQGTLTAVDVADLAPDRQVVVSVLQHRDRTCSGLGV